MNTAEVNLRRSCSRYSIGIALALLAVVFKADPLVFLAGDRGNSGQAYGAEKGDYNRDGVIDLDDLQIFSIRRLGLDWEDVDWCQWIHDEPDSSKQMGGLYDFVLAHFGCDQSTHPGSDPFAVENRNDYPTRLAWGPSGYLYVSDAKAGSVFIYDPNLVVIGELKGLDKPLGVAVDPQGNIYVGNNGRDNVEVYDYQGAKVTTLGRGLVKMPNDLAIDRSGRLYVVDSKNDAIWVFDPNGGVLRSIGSTGDGLGEFRFPAAATVAYYVDPSSGREVGELYVADQGHSLIKVFDLEGNYLRSFGGTPSQGMMGYKWQGKFAMLQSLELDSHGRIHAVDTSMSVVQILDSVTGGYIASYGSFGTGPGQLNLPLDVVIDGYGQVVAANANNKRVEIIYLAP